MNFKSQISNLKLERAQSGKCAARITCSAGFQTCCVADFQIGRSYDVVSSPGLRTCDVRQPNAKVYRRLSRVHKFYGRVTPYRQRV